MDDSSVSGIIDGQFITEVDAMTVYESSSSHGFNQVVKVMRQGKWFILKGLKPEYRDEQMYIEMLKKEYDLTSQLDHPNIVKAFAKEMNPNIGPCIVMEYVDGVTLDEFLASKPTASARKKVVDQLVETLCYIHGKQIIHRDLKPSNILIASNGNNLKIIDFGLSDADDYAILKQPAGTLKYMAPEQKDSTVRIDGRADIYAFGLLLHKIFPHRYTHISAKCSRLNRERRYSNADDLRRAFERQARWHWAMPIIIGVALAVLPTLLMNHKVVVNSNGNSEEFVELLGIAEHIIDSMYQPVIDRAGGDVSETEAINELTERMKECRSRLKNIQSPLLDDPRMSVEFRNAWELKHADKYNEVCSAIFGIDTSY